MSKISSYPLTTNARTADAAPGLALPIQPPTPELSPPREAWLNNLTNAAQDKPQDTPATDGSQEFWIGKSSDAKVLRDELLTEHFNFSPEDLAAYKKNGGGLMIRDTGKCSAAEAKGLPCEWATPEDIAEWGASAGKISITLDAETAKGLRDFRQGRVIDRAVMDIADPALRASVRKDLLQAATGQGPDKIAAANRLLHLETANAGDLAATRRAILEVAAQPENRDNAVTTLVAGAVRLTDVADRADTAARTIGPQNISGFDREISDAAWQVNKAGQLAAGVNPVTGKVNTVNLNRAEAAWVNQQAAQLLRVTGDDDQAAYRERIGRYFEADDKERSTAWANGTIDRWKSGNTPFMRGVTPEEQAWQDHLNTVHTEEPNPLSKTLSEDKFKREWKVPKVWGEKSLVEIDDKDNLTNKPLVRYNMRGSLRVSGTATVIEGYRYVDEKGRPVRQGKPYFYKNEISTNRTIESPELNRDGITRAYGVASAVDLLNQANKWTPIVADVIRGRSIVGEHFKLEKDAFNATHFPVPPKPEDLPQERAKLLRMLGTSKQAEVRINELMRSLEEQSHAFWGR